MAHNGTQTMQAQCCVLVAAAETGVGWLACGDLGPRSCPLLPSTPSVTVLASHKPPDKIRRCNIELSRLGHTTHTHVRAGWLTSRIWKLMSTYRDSNASRAMDGIGRCTCTSKHTQAFTHSRPQTSRPRHTSKNEAQPINGRDAVGPPGTRTLKTAQSY